MEEIFLLPGAILAEAGCLHTDTALLLSEGRISALVPGNAVPPRARRREYPGELWTAAPVLVHAHLEGHDAPSAEWDRSGFAAWAGCLLDWRETPGRLPPAASAARTLQELSAAGCGLVAAHIGENEAGSGDRPGCDQPLLPELLRMPEVFAPDPAAAAAELARLDARPPAPGTGLALHAPFSVSEGLARGVFGRARGWAVPVSIHLGEHDEERRFLARGEGPLAELFRRRGRPLKTGRWASPVDWLEEAGGLRPGTLVVHGGDLSPAELARLAAAGVGTVWCPGTHFYFDRPAPSFARDGLPIPALGCDSRASNAALDPLRELRLARRLLPGLGPQGWWRALTEVGAEALGRTDLGVLGAGRRARVLRLPWDGRTEAAAVCDRLTADAELRPLGPAREAPFAEAQPGT